MKHFDTYFTNLFYTFHFVQWIRMALHWSLRQVGQLFSHHLKQLRLAVVSKRSQSYETQHSLTTSLYTRPCKGGTVD